MITRRGFMTLTTAASISSAVSPGRSEALTSASSPMSGPNRQNAKIAQISYGDVVEQGEKLSSTAAIEKVFQALRDAGFTTVYWRMLWEGHPIENVIFYSSQSQPQIYQAKQSFANTPYPWDPHEIRWPIEVAHKLGLKFYAWVVVYNEGAPPGALQEYGIPPLAVNTPYGLIYESEFPYQTRFVHDHPECQLVDRLGKQHHYGVLEWAYPEARQYWLKELDIILNHYAVDGIYLDTRTECMSPQFADQYGFNQPIVEEYEKRYGINIREEDFDLEQWRNLRGEYFTLLLQEMSKRIHAKGKQFSVGTSRGDYVGFPLGNMKLQWRQWISDAIIDELALETHGWAWGKPGYGYMTDFPTGRGLKPFDQSIRQDYDPVCKKHGIKLYFAKSSCYKPRPLVDQCCNSRATLNAIKLPPGWCDQMAAMPEFDGTMESAQLK